MIRTLSSRTRRLEVTVEELQTGLDKEVHEREMAIAAAIEARQQTCVRLCLVIAVAVAAVVAVVGGVVAVVTRTCKKLCSPHSLIKL